MIIPAELTFPQPVKSVFDTIIDRDWYDGISSGAASSQALSATFRFDIIAWGPAQEVRVFVGNPLEAGVFEQVAKLETTTDPKSFYVQSKELLRSAIGPRFAFATDSSFESLLSMRLLDTESEKLLPDSFDGLPHLDYFDYWKTFLSL